MKESAGLGEVAEGEPSGKIVDDYAEELGWEFEEW